MDDYLKEALEIVKAQAKVRIMGEEEILSMVQQLAEGIRNACAGVRVEEEPAQPAPVRNSIKEQAVVCLECGKTFKVLTKKHLALHGLKEVRLYGCENALFGAYKGHMASIVAALMERYQRLAVSSQSDVSPAVL